MNAESIAKVKEMLSDKSVSVAVISHSNPDGDALGSALAVRGILGGMGISNVKVLMPNTFPEFLAWMPWQEEVMVATKNHRAASKVLKEANLIFCVDFNSPARVENLEKELRSSAGIKVLIDHHPNPEPGFDFYLTDFEASSTAELVFELFWQIGAGHHVSIPVAQCIYAAIITDTGSLSYGCNNPRTYEIVARLVRLGIDAENLQKRIYSNYSENRLRLLGYSIGEKLVVLPQFKTAYISLSKEDLKRFNFKVGDTEGIVNYALSIKGINLAAIFLQYQGYVKVSFRSEGTVDVNILAREHFNGGGHKKAAGGKSHGGLDEAIKKFEEILGKL